MSAIPTIIRIYYNPPEGATVGVRCGGEGNEWSKFYYSSKKGEAWECTVPMKRPPGGEPIEFKPVLQFNSPPPSSPSLHHSPPSPSHPSHPLSPHVHSPSTTNSLSPVKLAASPSFAKFSFTSPDLRTQFLRSSSSAFLKNSSSSLSNSSSLAKTILASPLRPSSFSCEGERDETYAIGANYVVEVGHSIDIYPWFYTLHGDIETIENVESTILKDKRNVVVYTPPSYTENPLKKYPVLLMQDAHNLFYEHISFCGRIWKIPFTMNELCISGAIQETIIVAVTPIQRAFEYLPPTPGGKSDGGGAELYLDFISKELKPLIAKKYRITGEYGIAGSSYGGIISLYAWLTRPGEFTKCGCYSPSLKWHKNYMFEVAAKVCANFSTTHAKHLMYLDAGTDHDQILAVAKLAKKLEKSFQVKEPKPLAQSEGDNKPRAVEVIEKVAAITGIDSTFDGIRHVPPVNSYAIVLQSGKIVSLFEKRKRKRGECMNERNDVIKMLNVGEGHNHSEDSWAKRTPLALSFLLRDNQRESRWVKDVVDDISARVL